MVRQDTLGTTAAVLQLRHCNECSLELGLTCIWPPLPSQPGHPSAPQPQLRPTCLQGRVVNFKNAVIILTSNIGSATILESMNAGDFEGMKNTVTQQVGGDRQGGV